MFACTAVFMYIASLQKDCLFMCSELFKKGHKPLQDQSSKWHFKLIPCFFQAHRAETTSKHQIAHFVFLKIHLFYFFF